MPFIYFLRFQVAGPPSLYDGFAGSAVLPLLPWRRRKSRGVLMLHIHDPAVGPDRLLIVYLGGTFPLNVGVDD